MFEKIKWLNLQLFAGEGGAGTGAASGGNSGEVASTGDTSADAGREQRLLALGVPADKIRRNRSTKQETATELPENAVSTVPPEQRKQQAVKQDDAAGADKAEEIATEAPTKMSWDDIVKDPEYNREIQKIVQSRLKDAKASEDKLSKLTPALEVLARHYKLDYENLDVDALTKAINGDRDLYEEIALAQGLPVEQVMQSDQTARDDARRRREEARTIEQQRVSQHIERLKGQGEALKATFPNFDLRTELKNPVFARLVSPGVNLSVEDAYYAIHRNEIQAATAQATAQKTAEMISQSIQSGQRRPSEHGTSGQAPSVSTFDYRNASREQRALLKKRIAEAAQRGEKLYPGS